MLGLVPVDSEAAGYIGSGAIVKRFAFYLSPAPRFRSHLRDGTAHQESRHSLSVMLVVVPEEAPSLLSEGRRFPELLHDPLHVRCTGDSEVPDPSATVVEDEKDVECLEVGRGGRSEVQAPRFVDDLGKFRVHRLILDHSGPLE